MLLAKFPRIQLAHAPTPLEPLSRLTQLLGGPKLWIKRDDCTGLATGGNKTRKLEFLIADAKAQGCDVIITTGAVQSNHARQTAAACAKVGGLKAVLVLNGAEPAVRTGNILLDDLLGAEARIVNVERAGRAKAMQAVADEMRGKGHKPYVIPSGGSSPVGALGYVAVVQEMLQQSFEQGVNFQYIVAASGSAGTQAGLVVGAEVLRTGAKVLGISVADRTPDLKANVLKLARQTVELMGVNCPIAEESVIVHDEYFGEGYAQPTPGMVEALRLVASTEGIILDPVYTGKAMAGLMDLVRKGRFKKDDNVVFVHTGGVAGLFAPAQVESFQSRHAKARV